MRERLDLRCVARAARAAPCCTLLAALGCGAARGCSFMPAYERPAAPVPATYPEVAAAGSATPAPAPTRPQPTSAGASSRRSAAAPADRAGARATTATCASPRSTSSRRARSTRSSAPSCSRRSTPRAVARTSVCPRRRATTGRACTSHQYAANIGFAAYELDFFGRMPQPQPAALEQYFATAEARRSTHISLVAEVASAYFTLAADQERLELAQGTLASADRDLQPHAAALRPRRGVEPGAAPGADDRRGRARRRRALPQPGHARPQRARAAGRRAGAERAAARRARRPDAMRSASCRRTCPRTCCSAGPTSLTAEQLLKAANANIGAARAAFFPRIALTAAAGSASLSLSDLFGSDSGTWTFAPTVSVPIFNAGACAANLDVAGCSATSTSRATSAASRRRSARSPTRSRSAPRSTSNCRRSRR